MADADGVRHDRNAQRSWRRTGSAVLQIAGHVCAPWRRPWRVRWGARDDEPPPGISDEQLIPEPSWSYVHAISIDAPVEAVWPWIVQLGQGRGGFYAFERLENLFGCRIRNTDRIEPGLQHLAVGDVIRLHPKAPPLHVAVLVPNRSLVLRGATEPGTVPDNVWGFHLCPDAPGTCRLIETGRTVHGCSIPDRLFLSTLIVEPVGFVMGREMLLGVKSRAESW